MSLSQRVKDVLAKENIEARFDEPMHLHTAYKIGGKADCAVFPNGVAQIKTVVELCRAEDIPYAVIGGGTNLLVSDDGIRGVVIICAKNMRTLEADGERIRAGAGVLLGKVASFAAELSLTGMEPISGIFGCVGGAVAMNAGAYGGEVSDVLESVVCYSPAEDCVLTLTPQESEYGYRTSIYLKRGYIVLEAVFKLQFGDKTQIRSAMAEFAKRRNDKQPLEFPSCGSVFKRPEGHFAGALIEQAGLKGYQIGGAAVSEKHAGFIINKGGATAADVCALIAYIQETVKARFGVELECEVKTLGFDTTR